jgi:hypothetical protein
MKIKLMALLAVAAQCVYRGGAEPAVVLGNAEDAEALAKENAALKSKVSKLESARGVDDKAVREKMAAGLSREQAEAAVKHQAAFSERFDAVKAEAKKKAKGA